MTTLEYPVQFESDVVLRTGRTMHIRPVRGEDQARLLHFYERLSPESLHARFFSVLRPEIAAAASPVNVDYDREFGAVAEIGGEIEGVAHYFAYRKRPEAAEVAFAISDAAQGCGAGTKLLETPRRRRADSRHSTLRGRSAGGQPTHAQRLSDGILIGDDGSGLDPHGLRASSDAGIGLDPEGRQ